MDCGRRLHLPKICAQSDPPHTHYKSKMAAAAILKNWNIAISRPRFNRFWRNLARWCTSNLLTIPIVKNLKFCNHLNIAISQPRFARFRRNLVRLCSSTLSGVPTVKNFKFQKSKMAAAAILKNWKIAISRPRFNRFWRNLARWRISNLLTVPTVKNLKFYKSNRRPAS